MTELNLSQKLFKQKDGKLFAYADEIKKTVKQLKEEMNDIQKINMENSYKSGVSEPLRKRIMEIIVGSFMELEDRINKIFGEKLI